MDTKQQTDSIRAADDQLDERTTPDLPDRCPRCGCDVEAWERFAACLSQDCEYVLERVAVEFEWRERSDV